VKTITRNGGDGAFLRQVGLSNTGITLIMDEDTVGDGERNHGGDEQPSIFAFSESFTTPVTLNKAEVTRFNRDATFNWETSAETFHLGFNLWGETSDGWVQLNNRLIKSNGDDTDQTQTYSQTVRLTRRESDEITEFGISSVDNTGYEEFYGPFSEGEEYGEEANNEPVDWTNTRTAFEQSMRERGFVKVNNRWRRLSADAKALVKNTDLGVDRAMFDVHVDTAGIHSIDAGQLIALNPSWDRVRLNRIALTVNGNAIPRHIISSNRRLDEEDRIVFNVNEVSGQDTPFLDLYTYRLSIDRSNARDANTFDGTGIDEQSVSDDGLISEILTSRKLHSGILATGDPWYDARLLSVGDPASVNYNADFSHPINTEKQGVLDLVLFGSLDLPGDQDDHHIQVSVNDELVADARFDGLTEYREQIILPAGLLKTADNTVRITVVGDTGLFADVVLVDEVSLSAFSALSDKASFDFAHDIESAGYRINTSDELEVYAYTNTGLLTSVETLVGEDSIQFESLPFQTNTSNDAQARVLLIHMVTVITRLRH